MNITTFLLLIAFFGITISDVSNAETAVIVHPSNGDALDAELVKRIFLGKTRKFPGGASVVPLNHPEGATSRSEFNDKVLSKSDSQLKAYWSKLIFTGKGTPPKDVDGDADMKSLIATNPNMIGYIDSSMVDDSVKVVISL